MKEAAGRKARYGGHTADNDHQIYRMLPLCPPLIRGTIPPWVLLLPFCVRGAAVRLFLGHAHHYAPFLGCMAVNANSAAWQKRKDERTPQGRALTTRSAVGPCWIHQAGRINHGHDHDIPRDDQHNVIDTYARGTKSKSWDGRTVKKCILGAIDRRSHSGHLLQMS